MVFRTYLDKNNTIQSNSSNNTGLNPIAQLFYGGNATLNAHSRFLLHFDETRLVNLYTGGTIPDLSKLTHTLNLTNTGAFDNHLLNGTYAGQDRTSSFDLILFKINQPWDEGVGYDYGNCDAIIGECSQSIAPSNWNNAQTSITWANGAGVYSGSASGITIGTQHFDAGNENIKIDITTFVNGLLTGDTNYGLGIAYSGTYESLNTLTPQYVGFFSRHTNTFYEPYVETIYSNYIKDDRNNFFLDKANTLYLYVNLAGNPTNLDYLPFVLINDQNGDIYASYEPSGVTHVTKGVYSINITIPSSAATEGYLFNDSWSGIIINGVSRPDISLDFELKDSFGYYNIGNSDSLPRKVAVSCSGIQNQEKIKRGDIRKIIISTRIPYTVEQTQNISNLKYRLYVKEGRNEVTVIDFQPIEMATNHNYFLLDTQSLIPNTYYIDILCESNLEVTTLNNVLNFTIISESNDRTGQ